VSINKILVRLEGVLFTILAGIFNLNKLTIYYNITEDFDYAFIFKLISTFETSDYF